MRVNTSVNIAEKLAEVKDISLDKISEVTNRNASNLFKILLKSSGIKF